MIESAGEQAGEFVTRLGNLRTGLANGDAAASRNLGQLIGEFAFDQGTAAIGPMLGAVRGIRAGSGTHVGTSRPGGTVAAGRAEHPGTQRAPGNRNPLESDWSNLPPQQQHAISGIARGADDIVIDGNGTPPIDRVIRDESVSRVPPPPMELERPISRSATQNLALRDDIAYLESLEATNIRVNQQQIGSEIRIGVNRPDLQAKLPDGRRVYIEYNPSSSTCGPVHADRILANDPNGLVILRRDD